MKLAPEQSLYVRSMGKLLRVTAIFRDVAQANAYMSKNNDAVVAEFGDLILLADMYDHGLIVAKEAA